MKKENKVKAISFQEVYNQKRKFIPDEIISAINELLIEKFDCVDNSASFDLYEISERSKITKAKIEENDWLCFTYLYEEQGWDVQFIEPDENEIFVSYYYFTKK